MVLTAIGHNDAASSVLLSIGSGMAFV